MFFAKYSINNRESCGLYYDYAQYHKDTFSPDCELITFIVFTVNGKGYQNRKESVRTIAINWSNADTDGISYGELSEIQDWFEKNGKRYGLLEEFRENAIC